MKDKIWNLLLIAVSVITALTAFVARGAISDMKELRDDVRKIDNRVVIIESTRFTNADARQLYGELGEIKTSIARIEQQLRQK